MKWFIICIDGDLMIMYVDFKNLEKSVRVKMIINDEKFEMFFFLGCSFLKMCSVFVFWCVGEME